MQIVIFAWHDALLYYVHPTSSTKLCVSLNLQFTSVEPSMSLSCFSFVSLSLGLSACNSSGHLSNHPEVAPNHAGITFAISNTLVSPCIGVFTFLLLHCRSFSED